MSALTIATNDFPWRDIVAVVSWSIALLRLALKGERPDRLDHANPEQPSRPRQIATLPVLLNGLDELPRNTWYTTCGILMTPEGWLRDTCLNPAYRQPHQAIWSPLGPHAQKREKAELPKESGLSCLSIGRGERI